MPLTGALRAGQDLALAGYAGCVVGVGAGGAFFAVGRAITVAICEIGSRAAKNLVEV